MMTVPSTSAIGPVLEVRNLDVAFNIGRRRTVHAVSGVSFGINRQETLGLVGESGCGKSSLARAILQLPPPTSGQVLLAGRELTTMPAGPLRAIRSRIQMVFQDPVSSLNPGRRIGRSLAEPLRIMGIRDKAETLCRVRTMLTAVGLDPGQFEDRLPGRLSGGQCQRVSIARALLSRPAVLLCDEPVSALDVSVQAQILNLLNKIRADFSLAMLFISHDLAVVKRISDRVAVMYLGTICELAPAEALYYRPAHPYTAALLNAIPRPIPGNRRLAEFPGVKGYPAAITPPSGCPFHLRCPRRRALCTKLPPLMAEIVPGHHAACHCPLV